MHSKTLLISAICLLIGFVAAYFIFDAPPTPGKTETVVVHSISNLSDEDVDKIISNPFSPQEPPLQDNSRVNNLENEISLIKRQLQKIEQDIQKINTSAASDSRSTPVNNEFTSALFSRRLYGYDNLVKAGIEPGFAEDIVRRKNAVELKTLELRDRATRGGYLNSQRYYDELTDINKQKISLRDELGDDQYDEYLYNSKQNNRIKITSVMLGSSAEQAGIQKGDIVLNYDNKRMFSWQELKTKTTEGQLGEYVSISIYRNGEIFSFSVPRGPLGTQLGATRLVP